jgi:hypothetical protein
MIDTPWKGQGNNQTSSVPQGIIIIIIMMKGQWGADTNSFSGTIYGNSYPQVSMVKMVRQDWKESWSLLQATRQVGLLDFHGISRGYHGIELHLLSSLITWPI